MQRTQLRDPERRGDNAPLERTDHGIGEFVIQAALLPAESHVDPVGTHLLESENAAIDTHGVGLDYPEKLIQPTHVKGALVLSDTHLPQHLVPLE